MASTLMKHVQFFDLNNDGKIMPWETFTAFRRLGYSLWISIMSTLVINGTMSYSSQDSWLPDPFFSILIKNIHKCKHGGDSGIYGHEGEMYMERINQLFQRFGRDGRLEFMGVFDLTNYHRVVFDVYGYCAAKIEWFISYLLLIDKGYMTKEDLKGIIDGSIFYEKDAVNKQQAALFK